MKKKLPVVYGEPSKESGELYAKALITARFALIAFTLFFVFVLVSFELVSFLKRFASLICIPRKSDYDLC